MKEFKVVRRGKSCETEWDRGDFRLNMYPVFDGQYSCLQLERFEKRNDEIGFSYTTTIDPIIRIQDRTVALMAALEILNRLNRKEQRQAEDTWKRAARSLQRRGIAMESQIAEPDYESMTLVELTDLLETKAKELRKRQQNVQYLIDTSKAKGLSNRTKGNRAQAHMMAGLQREVHELGRIVKRRMDRAARELHARKENYGA